MPRRKSRALPKRSHAEVLEAFPELRQSFLADDDDCALMTRFGLEGYAYDNHAQARGKLFHEFAAECLRTLRRTGEVMMPVAEALELLYEVCAQREVPDAEVVVIPMRERLLLRIAVITFVSKNTFNMDRLIDVEKRLYATLEYPHPETGDVVRRKVTGQPDALIADPPEGCIIPDWKTTLQAPPEYKGEREGTPAGVSYHGYFQQRVYALLVFANYPSVQRVTLREFYVLSNQARVATVHRYDIEHVERELAAQVELLDRKLRGGSRSPLWRPSPGKHCTYCPRPAACPIEREARGEGSISGPIIASRIAGEWLVAKEINKHHMEALKAWVEVYGPVPVKDGKGRSEVRWGTTKGGGRRFGVWPVETSDRGPADASLEAAFSEAAERKRAAA